MGLDSTYYLPAGIRRRDVEEFLILLGYEKYPSQRHFIEYQPSTFHYFSKKPYESLQGVTFTVVNLKGKIQAHGRNNIWRNKSDNEFHNCTLRQLRKRFDGYFISDYGRNRYFPFDEADRRDAEAGCFIEVENALDRLKEISILIKSFKRPTMPVQKGGLVWLNQSNPEIILGNLAVVQILSVIEGFFKKTYIALLTFSEKKPLLIKSSQISNADLMEIGEGNLRIEEAFSNGLNFQNAEAICKNFDQLDQNLALRQELKKKYGRRKENFHHFLERIAAHRHRIVHHGERHWAYDMDSLKKDLGFCEALIHRIYESITKRRGWMYEKPY